MVMMGRVHTKVGCCFCKSIAEFSEKTEFIMRKVENKKKGAGWGKGGWDGRGTGRRGLEKEKKRTLWKKGLLWLRLRSDLTEAYGGRLAQKRRERKRTAGVKGYWLGQQAKLRLLCFVFKPIIIDMIDHHTISFVIRTIASLSSNDRQSLKLDLNGTQLGLDGMQLDLNGTQLAL